MDNDKMPAGLGCNEGLGVLPEHSMDMHMVAIPMRCRDDAKRYAERYAKAYAEHAVARERQRTMFSRRPGLWALQAREVLELIAAPQRPDGTWNRDREACRKLAAEALGRYEDSETPNAEAKGPRSGPA